MTWMQDWAAGGKIRKTKRHATYGAPLVQALR